LEVGDSVWAGMDLVGWPSSFRFELSGHAYVRVHINDAPWVECGWSVGPCGFVWVQRGWRIGDFRGRTVDMGPHEPNAGPVWKV